MSATRSKKKNATNTVHSQMPTWMARYAGREMPRMDRKTHPNHLQEGKMYEEHRQKSIQETTRNTRK